MIDLKLLRENPDAVRASQRARGEDPGLVDALLDSDTARRAAVSSADNLRAEQKAASKKVGKASPNERPALLAAAKELADTVKAAESEQSDAEKAFTAAHMAISNVIIDGVPAGGEDDFVVLDTVGEPRAIDNPKDHVELGESLGLIDLERGAKVSGARFYFLTGRRGVAAARAAAARGAAGDGERLHPDDPAGAGAPEVMAGTGFLGAHSEEVYRARGRRPLSRRHIRGGAGRLPRRRDPRPVRTDRCATPGGRHAFGARRAATARTPAASSACTSSTRSRDSSTARRSEAEAEHERLLGWQKEMLAKIEVPYRVIDIAAGDLGSSAARKFDCEAWIPTQQAYRELTSTSNCTTFQARRLAVRYRDENAKPQTAATLNGTLATTRWLVAILENHQQPDGSVRVPEALLPFVGTEVLEPTK